MTPYAAFVRSRFKSMNRKDSLMHAAAGVCGEAGELMDVIKKHWAYNKPLEEENVLEELGDLMFYIQAMCNEFGWNLSFLMAENTRKLEKRYPTGYTDADAIAQADKATCHEFPAGGVGECMHVNLQYKLGQAGETLRTCIECGQIFEVWDK